MEPCGTPDFNGDNSIFRSSKKETKNEFLFYLSGGQLCFTFFCVQDI